MRNGKKNTCKVIRTNKVPDETAIKFGAGSSCRPGSGKTIHDEVTLFCELQYKALHFLNRLLVHTQDFAVASLLVEKSVLIDGPMSNGGIH